MKRHYCVLFGDATLALIETISIAEQKIEKVSWNIVCKLPNIDDLFFLLCKTRNDAVCCFKMLYLGTTTLTLALAINTEPLRMLMLIYASSIKYDL